MASNDFANTAAAVSAGYSLQQFDRGLPANGFSPAERFETVLEKYVGGVAGDPASMLRAFGYGASQVAADAVCVASVNAIRANRYGADSAAPSTTVHALPPNTQGSTTGPATAALATVKHTKDIT